MQFYIINLPGAEDYMTYLKIDYYKYIYRENSTKPETSGLAVRMLLLYVCPIWNGNMYGAM